MSVARTNTTWDLVIYNPVLGREPITDESEDVSVTYALTHNGSAAGSGSLVYEDHEYENAWSKRLTLPATPGILVAVVTATATVDDEVLTGTRQVSLQVV